MIISKKFAQKYHLANTKQGKRQIEKLDHYLTKAIQYLINNWYREEVGIVSCVIADENKLAFGTSIKKENQWIHAEKNALFNFENLYGPPSENAVFIITLSPCLQRIDESNEPTCVNVIKNKGINRIHFGAMYSTDISLLNYEQMGFKATLTENIMNKIICEKINSLFTTFNTKIDTELLQIKKELGDDFFAGFKFSYSALLEK